MYIMLNGIHLSRAGTAPAGPRRRIPQPRGGVLVPQAILRIDDDEAIQRRAELEAFPSRNVLPRPAIGSAATLPANRSSRTAIAWCCGRVVLWLRSEPVTIAELEMLDWRDPAQVHQPQE